MNSERLTAKEYNALQIHTKCIMSPGSLSYNETPPMQRVNFGDSSGFTTKGLYPALRNAFLAAPSMLLARAAVGLP